MNLFFFLGNAGTVLFIAAIFAITPVLIRKSLLFGVRIPEAAADLPECKSLKYSYYTLVAIGSLIVVAASVIQYLAAPEYSLLCWMYFPFVMIGVQFAAFIPQWKKAVALKSERGWNVPLTGLVDTRSAVSREKLSHMRWGWHIANLALVVIMIVWTVIVYPGVPDRLILHWSAAMQPDRWGDKNIMNVMIMPLVALGFALLMAACNIIVYRQKLQVSAEHPQLSFAQHRLYRRMLGNALGFMTFCFTVMFAFIQPTILNMFAPSNVYMSLVIGIACVLGIVPVIYAPIKAGQSGCKLKPSFVPDSLAEETASTGANATHPGRGDDRFWKLGMFYYNTDDPSVLVEDRFGGGGGSGFNYARIQSKIFVIAIAVIIIAAYIPLTIFLLRYPIS